MRRTRGLISLLPLVLLLGFIGISPAAADPLTWSAPSGLPSSASINAVSCPSENLCVAVGSRPGGSVILVSNAPADPASWTVALNAAGSGFSDVSCPTTNFCIAVRGIVVAVSNNPAAGTFTESTLDGQVGDKITCTSETLCVSNGYRNINWRNTYGVAPFTNSANWTAMPVPPSGSFNDITCVGAQCLAVSSYGIHGTASLAQGAAFTQARFPGDPAPWLQPAAISCVASTCMLVTDGSGFPNPPDGGLYVSTDRTTWTRSTLPDVALPAGLECAQSGGAVRCVTVTLADKGGFTNTVSIADTSVPGAINGTDWAVLPALFGTSTGGSDNIRAIGCASPYLCLAFAPNGRLSVGKAPVPDLGGNPTPTDPSTTPARTAVQVPKTRAVVSKQGKAIFAVNGNPGDTYAANLTARVPSSSVRSLSAKRVSLKLGSAKGTFDAAGKAKVTLKISKKGRTAVKRLGTVKATLKVTSSPRGGTPTSKQFAVTLKKR
ncbi:MAG: hypothetical protein U0R27_12555 [Candidatus Nanopelagicales bacterium]